MSMKTALQTIAYSAAALSIAAGPAIAQERLQVAPAVPTASSDRQDELLRLPGNGELKEDEEAQGLKSGGKLVPGGGLLLSFDTNGNGIIETAELEAGIDAAFMQADANGSGSLTPLEQQSWAESLPTYDASLANPVRFDPNLNQVVSPKEFKTVIRSLAADHKDEETGTLLVSKLMIKPKS
ncbi:MAG: hypothetical protein AAFX02_03995 [Pseudomonadota bacterium]